MTQGFNRKEIKTEARKKVSGKRFDYFTSIFLCFILSLVLTPFTLGLSWGIFGLALASYNLSIMRKGNTSFKSIKEALSNYGSSMVLFAQIVVRTFLWSLLFVIPGIIALYRYSLSFYVLADNPDLSATEVLSKSKELTNGRKMELFIMDLSFLGFLLLAIISFGLVGFYYIPYYHMSWAGAYETLSGKFAKGALPCNEDCYTFNIELGFKCLSFFQKPSIAFLCCGVVGLLSLFCFNKNLWTIRDASYILVAVVSGGLPALSLLFVNTLIDVFNALYHGQSCVPVWESLTPRVVIILCLIIVMRGLLGQKTKFNQGVTGAITFLCGHFLVILLYALQFKFYQVHESGFSLVYFITDFVTGLSDTLDEMFRIFFNWGNIFVLVFCGALAFSYYYSIESYLVSLFSNHKPKNPKESLVA